MTRPKTSLMMTVPAITSPVFTVMIPRVGFGKILKAPSYSSKPRQSITFTVPGMYSLQVPSTVYVIVHSPIPAAEGSNSPVTGSIQSSQSADHVPPSSETERMTTPLCSQISSIGLMVMSDSTTVTVPGLYSLHVPSTVYVMVHVPRPAAVGSNSPVTSSIQPPQSADQIPPGSEAVKTTLSASLQRSSIASIMISDSKTSTIIV